MAHLFKQPSVRKGLIIDEAHTIKKWYDHILYYVPICPTFIVLCIGERVLERFSCELVRSEV